MPFALQRDSILSMVLLELSSSPYTKAPLQEKVKAALAEEAEEATQALVSSTKGILPFANHCVYCQEPHI
jgi:hypothetical protein